LPPNPTRGHSSSPLFGKGSRDMRETALLTPPNPSVAKVG
jgi:hypothetical protein